METFASALDVAAWHGVWIAIPAYNEARSIRALAQQALAHCPRVIVVDDGSSDGTAARLDDLPLTLLSHDTNRGKASSLRTAFAHALAHGAQAVIALDGDGQHDPADAAHLLAAWRQHRDHIVIGSRLHDRTQFPVARWRANRVACFWISWASGHAIADSQSGFRVYPREVMAMALEHLASSMRFTFESEVLIEAAQRGHPTLAVAIAGCYPVSARPSHFRPVIDITRIVVMVARRLLLQGMAPLGLWRSLRRAKVLPGRLPAQTSSTPDAAAHGARSAPQV
jgi:hypothetical protein